MACPIELKISAHVVHRGRQQRGSRKGDLSLHTFLESALYASTYSSRVEVVSVNTTRRRGIAPSPPAVPTKMSNFSGFASCKSTLISTNARYHDKSTPRERARWLGLVPTPSACCRSCEDDQVSRMPESGKPRRRGNESYTFFPNAAANVSVT